MIIERDNSSVPALEKGFDVLEYVASFGSNGEGVVEISKNLKIPQASAFRIINTLINRGYLYKENGTGNVLLGYRSLMLSRQIPELEEFINICMPSMEKLLKETAKTVELTIYKDNQITFVNVLESSDTIRYVRKVGSPLVGSTNPISLSVLTFIANDERSQFLNKMEKSRKQAVRLNSKLEDIFFSKEINKAKLSLIKKEIVAYDFGVQTKDVSRIAAPLFNGTGEVVGTIGIAGPKFYMEKKRAKGLIESVKKIAYNLSNKSPLGGFRGKK